MTGGTVAGASAAALNCENVQHCPEAKSRNATSFFRSSTTFCQRSYNICYLFNKPCFHLVASVIRAKLPIMWAAQAGGAKEAPCRRRWRHTRT